MTKYFNDIQQVKFEGGASKNPFAFKYYNPEEIIGEKTMKEHLRFSMAYWHTFNADGSDPFGAGTMLRPWDKFQGMDQSKARAEAAFELFGKLDMPYYAFHDVDIAPEGDTLRESFQNTDQMVAVLKDYMKASGVKLLWNTANMFTNPRYVHGAATSSNADVFAYSAAKVKKGLEVAKELGSENYVFWGGREGYDSLLNTDMGLELDNLARFMHLAVDYAKEIGYTGQFLIEPKPKEPTKHQYDFDVATALQFLQKYDLSDHFKMNIEANHATLAGHTFEHEIRVARLNGALGSLDANQGDPLLGWDTDEFPTDIYTSTLAMYEVLENGGIGSGGLNFDAKTRRSSIDPEDLVYAHIAGMDSFARGLKAAHNLRTDRVFEDAIAKRYSSYTEGIGLDIVEGRADFKMLEKYALEHDQIKNQSGRIELLRSKINQYIFEA